MANVIINADDFGLTESCTLAIADSFERGLVLETSMVSNGSAYELAANLILNHKLSDKVGIHFNLTEGKPLTDPIKCCADFVKEGFFHGQINRMKPWSRKISNAIYIELTAQIEKLMDMGISLSHADSHHHIHTAIFITPIVLRVCREHRIEKIRIHRNIGDISKSKKIFKYMYNQSLRWNGFKTTDYFGSMEDTMISGIYDNMEIMVHPDYDSNGILIDRIERNDGQPIGKPLIDFAKSEKVSLIGYKDL